METERWRQIDELFHSALGRGPAECAAFLAEACGGDAELRREVEELLAAHGRAGDFIERPAMEAEARALAAERAGSRPTLAAGARVGRYEVIRLIGRGGMGEVYLARDTSLGRNAALKLLPPDFTGDTERLRRFRAEARAASALNHPNIITVYEVGQADSAHFIAEEYVEGVTLRERMAGEGLDVSEALDIAAQAASALAAAHAKGIVHRDVKPDNIMVSRVEHILRRESYIKVLDFGIAKLTGPRTAGAEATTMVPSLTGDGVVVGTVPYMSPEQAKGLEVDGRTDIWSLGVVLYEMVSGRQPFEGPTMSHTIISILEKEPPPLRASAGEVPEELEWITARALRKEREERYQTAKELFIDLKELRRRLDEQARRESSVAPPPKQAATGGGAARATSPTESTPGRAGWRGRAALLALPLLLVAATGMFYGFRYWWGLRTDRPAAPFSKFKVLRLTSNGRASAAAVSPDGKYVVHVVGTAEQHSLRLRHIATGSDKEIVPAGGAGISNLSFSPDGNYIYFVRRGADAPFTLNVVPVLGGVAKALVSDIDSGVSSSPDGKRFAFIRGDPTKAEASLIVANADGTGERKLITRHMDELFFATAATPAWSPDGERIAFALRGAGAGAAYRNVTTVRVDGREQRQLTSEKWSAIETICWLPDGGGLVLTASEEERRNTQVWHTAYPTGEVRRITNDLNNYQGVSVTADGASLVTVLSEGRSDIWVAPVGDLVRVTQVTSNGFDGVSGIAWTPAGLIVHGNRVSGRPDLWIMNADGTDDRRLTSDAGLNLMPAVSPDGRYIVFLSNRTGSMGIWRMDIDGRNQLLLAPSTSGTRPSFTPDGRWVVFTAGNAGNTLLWKVPVEGGEPVRLTDFTSGVIGVSQRDGKIVCTLTDREAMRVRTAVIPPEGGAPLEMFDFPAYSGTIGPGFYGQSVRWEPDGRALNYLETKAGVSNLWSQPLGGGRPKQVTDYKSDLIIQYAWSPDGKRLALARGSVVNDVVLISDSR